MALDAGIQADRLTMLRATMREAGLDAVAIVPGANQHYLIGSHFHLMERPTVLIVPLEGEMRMILPALEKPDWDRLGVPARVHIWQDTDGSEAAFSAAVSDLGARRIGVEGQRMRVFEMLALRAHANAEIEDAQKPISRMRLAKDATEIALLRQAIELSEAGLAKTLADVRVGMTERQVNNLLLTNLFGLGAEGLSFPPIVVTGANAALPHASAGDTVIASGDTLLFDFGASKGGYNADITRTVFVGDPTDEARNLYAAVLAANARGREITRPGISAHDVDDAVTRVLEASPFSAYILHKTGHGLGLDVHEDPQVMRGNHAVLDVGQVITIEPGLYMSGIRGIRIEDDVVVTAEGCESLTTFTRDLTIVG